MNRVVVHECLDLRRPVPEVLRLVEKKECRFSGLCRLVEGRSQDPVLKPFDNLQDGLVETFEAGDLVELDAQDSTRLNTPLLQEMLDHLFEQGRLAYLTGTSQ